MVQPFWKIVWQFLTKLSMVLLYHLASVLLGINPTNFKICVYTKVCMKMFIVVSLTTARETEAPSAFFSRRMNEQTVAQPHNRILIYSYDILEKSQTIEIKLPICWSVIARSSRWCVWGKWLNSGNTGIFFSIVKLFCMMLYIVLTLKTSREVSWGCPLVTVSHFEEHWHKKHRGEKPRMLKGNKA